MKQSGYVQASAFQIDFPEKNEGDPLGARFLFLARNRKMGGGAFRGKKISKTAGNIPACLRMCTHTKDNDFQVEGLNARECLWWKTWQSCEDIRLNHNHF